MRKVMVMILTVLMIAFAVSCNNPNKSPTDKVGGYHVGCVTTYVESVSS